MTSISVIVCIYNSAHFLYRCIGSLQKQSFRDFEILLLDDGSTDDSGKICDDYAAKDSRIKVYHHENNGVAWERQFGIDNAKGEYSIHVDSDDWVEPDMLEKLYAEAKRTNADVVICDYFEDDGKEEKQIDQRPKSLAPEDVASEMFQRLHGSLCNKLVRQACYKKWGINVPDIMLCEDLYVSLSMMLHGAKVAYVPKAFYHYCRNENGVGITRPKNPRAGRYAYEMNIAFRQLLKPYPRHWAIYIRQSMPWLSYLVLYYGSVSGKEYKETFSEMSANPINSQLDKLTHFALRHYKFAQCLIVIRKIFSTVHRSMIKLNN